VKLGHPYTPERGRWWLIVVILAGLLTNLGMVFMLLGWAPAWVFLLLFLAFVCAAVAAVLDFVIPVLKDET
jgi:hypothetical protein